MNDDWPHVPTNEIRLSPDITPGYVHAGGLTEASAAKASELLTINHVAYHTRFKSTLHNHITHHLLALWALGATADEIQDMWEYNKRYQSPLVKVDAAIPADLDLANPDVFKNCLGNDDCYANFLKFFEAEIAEKGVQDVVREYVLKDDERAKDILCRMYSDLVHPMIHLGCGIEFKQPSLVAEALAGACVHTNYPAIFLLPTDEYIASSSKPTATSGCLLDVINSLAQDPTIPVGVRHTDPFNKIPDGFLKRVTPAQLAPHLSRFCVDQDDPADIRAKMADIMHTCAYLLGAAQRPGKRETMDFVLLHAVTLSVFYPAFMAQDWITNSEKARLLEAAARVSAVLYAGCACPPLDAQRIVAYAPRRPQDGWRELFHRSNVYHDEGHVTKLIRALFALEGLPEPPAGFPIAKNDFTKIAHMAVDSVERAMEPNGHQMPPAVAQGIMDTVGPGGEMVTQNMMRWVFYGGLEKAWDFVPDLELSSA